MQCDEVQVWTARPDELGPGACAELQGMLDAGERMRATRLRFDADRCAFIAAHALRRMALGLALGVDPKDLSFGTGAHGRPVLLDSNGSGPNFSLTRSRGLVACALRPAGCVGIDVEAIRSDPDASLLEPFMAQWGEGDDVHARLPLDFYLQWTALEAFWKARGLGLSSSQPRIALRALDADHCYEVVYAETSIAAGMMVLRLPAREGHVLSLACDEAATVQIVELDSLAAPPATEPHKALSKCKNSLCVEAAASNMLGT